MAADDLNKPLGLAPSAPAQTAPSTSTLPLPALWQAWRRGGRRCLVLSFRGTRDRPRPRSSTLRPAPAAIAPERTGSTRPSGGRPDRGPADRRPDRPRRGRHSRPCRTTADRACLRCRRKIWSRQATTASAAHRRRRAPGRSTPTPGRPKAAGDDIGSPSSSAASASTRTAQGKRIDTLPGAVTLAFAPYGDDLPRLRRGGARRRPRDSPADSARAVQLSEDRSRPEHADRRRQLRRRTSTACTGC